MVAQGKSFYEIVAKPTTIRSQSGYVNDVDADVWELRGKQINYGLLADAVKEGFLEEIKRQFATVLNSQTLSDSSVRNYFTALKDCLHFAFRGTGQKVGTLTSTMIEEWRDEALGVDYPYMLKLFISAVRARDPKAFPNVTNKVLKTLKKPEADVQHVLTLDSKKGPWLEREVLDQDCAIEEAYTSGAWHVEKFVFVQLFRFYGMRSEQLANMKIGDVRCQSTGHTKNEIRWPYAKNDLGVDQALWWPLGGSLLQAMEAYLALRLDCIPQDEQERLPLFTPDGLPGAWRVSQEVKSSHEPGYEGHLLGPHVSKRFTLAMRSLRLETSRSGKPELMNFNTRRERHTIGMRLALKGYSAQQIALRLSHKRPHSCNAYVDLARMAMQMRNPKFFHLMDDVGSVFTNPVVARKEIEEGLTPIISVEATKTTEVALIGGGSCRNCMFVGDATTGEPWPCLSCPRFQLYEDAVLQPLWDILQERRTYMQHEDGSWNNRFDPDIRAQFDRYEALLIGAERRRQEVFAERTTTIQGEIR
ncbi:hypothetical protein NBRC116599_29530 [Aquicoccus sp. SU-CL01552]